MYFSDKKKILVTIPHSAQRTHSFLVKRKEKENSKKGIPENKVALELLYHGLGHRYTSSLMSGETAVFFRILNLGYIQGLFAHNAIYLQFIKRLGPRLH